MMAWQHRLFVVWLQGIARNYVVKECSYDKYIMQVWFCQEKQSSRGKMAGADDNKYMVYDSGVPSTCLYKKSEKNLASLYEKWN